MSEQYRGYSISECVYVERRGSWYVQTYHITGLPYSEECCPLFSSPESARAWVDAILAVSDGAAPDGLAHDDDRE